MKTRRRDFVKGGAAAASGVALGGLLPGRLYGQAPAIVVPERARPSVEWGVAAGDVSGDRAIVWSRTDRPARMIVEYATTESFGDARRVVGPAALETSDFTAQVDLTGLPPGQQLFYRVSFQDLADLKTLSLPIGGRFKTAPARPSDISFAWSADTVGQGWGINPEWGGLRMYETMRQVAPDFFLHSGDTIYADNPLLPEVILDDGTLWKNLVTEAKSKVAETLAEFRGNFLYNLLDHNLRRFNSEIPLLVQWDDHETHNNWYPTQILDDSRYRVKSAALLAARAKRALFEYNPIRWSPDDPERLYRRIAYGPLLEVFVLDQRSYRGANSLNRQTALGEDAALLGPAQIAWLKQGLASSRALWKVIASDLPIGVVVRDGERDFEAVANGDDGLPLGRELEVADLLHFLKARGIGNVVWLTADVHYATAHHYHPDRAAFKDFLPFWEFVAGPIHAGTFGPSALDRTFGPEARFVGIPQDMKPNRPPSDGLQFFGTVQISAQTRLLTARLHDLAGKTLWSVEIEPGRA